MNSLWSSNFQPINDPVSTWWKTEAKSQFHYGYPTYLLKNNMWYRKKIKVNIKRRLREDNSPLERRMHLEEVQCMRDSRLFAFTLLEGFGWDADCTRNLLLPGSSSLRVLIFYITTLEHRNPLESWDESKYPDSHGEWEMVMPLLSYIPCSWQTWQTFCLRLEMA